MNTSNKNLNVTVIGIGEFGAKITKQISLDDNENIQTIIVDWRPAVFTESCAEKKIRIKKSGGYFDEAVRIRGSVQNLLAGMDVVFIVADMSEEIIRRYASVIAHVSKEIDILTLGIAALPFKTRNKRLYREAYTALLGFRREIAVAAFCRGRQYRCDDDKYSNDDIFDSIGNYGNIGYCWEVEQYSGTRNKVRTVSENISDSNKINICDIAMASIRKILKMISADYINDDAPSIFNALKVPGGLHISSAHNSVNKCEYGCAEQYLTTRVYILERKLTLSGIFDTRLDSAKSVLLHLTVPSDIQNVELKYLCEQILGRSGAEQFELSISVEDTHEKMLRAEVIATDVNTTDEWNEYCEE